MSLLCACGAGSSRGTSTSATQLCMDQTAAICDYVFRCYDDTMKASANFKNNYGSSAGECYTKLAVPMGCAGMDANPCGGGGRNYSVTQHQMCVKYLDGVACGTQLNTTAPPCNQCS